MSRLSLVYRKLESLKTHETGTIGEKEYKEPLNYNRSMVSTKTRGWSPIFLNCCKDEDD